VICSSSARLSAVNCDRLSRKHQQLAGLLNGMCGAGYLNHLKFPLKKHIFHIVKRGLDVLLREEFIMDEQAARRIREGDLKTNGTSTMRWCSPIGISCSPLPPRRLPLRAR
jgi:hypothetical protein